MFLICFDWNYIWSGRSSIRALFTPLSTQMSLYAGTAICMCIRSFLPWYSNITDTSTLDQYLLLCLLCHEHMERSKLPLLVSDFVLWEWDGLWSVEHPRQSLQIWSQKTGHSRLLHLCPYCLCLMTFLLGAALVCGFSSSNEDWCQSRHQHDIHTCICLEWQRHLSNN
jgi:hypothetical protein